MISSVLPIPWSFPHPHGPSTYASAVKPTGRSTRTRSRLPSEQLGGGMVCAGGETLSSRRQDKAAEDVVPTALQD